MEKPFGARFKGNPWTCIKVQILSVFSCNCYVILSHNFGFLYSLLRENLVFAQDQRKLVFSRNRCVEKFLASVCNANHSECCGLFLFKSLGKLCCGFYLPVIAYQRKGGKNRFKSSTNKLGLLQRMKSLHRFQLFPLLSPTYIWSSQNRFLFCSHS